MLRFDGLEVFRTESSLAGFLIFVFLIIEQFVTVCTDYDLNALGSGRGLVAADAESD